MKHEIYKPDATWYLLELIKLIAIDIISAYVLYRSFFGILIVFPVMYVLYKRDLLQCIKMKKNSFKESFKKLIQIVSGALEAGYSLENAYIYAVEELEKNEVCDKTLKKENLLIVNGIRCNRRIEDLLFVFGEKSQIEDVKSFASLVSIAKIYGGNIIAIIRKLAKTMEQKYGVEMEIETMISAKRLEGNMMIVMPFAMIIYMGITNGEYIDFLYSTPAGRIIMTGSLIVTVIAGLIIYKIVDIV